MHQVKWWVRKPADVKVAKPTPTPRPPEKNEGDVKVKPSKVNDG